MHNPGVKKIMSFVKYQHVERIDSDDVRGLLDGRCSVFPKMDGSNMGVFSTEDGNLGTMSRNVDITDTEEPFTVFARSHEGIVRFVRDFPGIRMYGEWMVPHTVRSYVPEVWNRWFVFDLVVEDHDAVYTYTGSDGIERTLDCRGKGYIPYDEYVPLLEAYGIDYIVRLCEIDEPTPNQLADIADNVNTWMMTTGCGEGIVVKRYDYRNQWGSSNWAKVINSAYSKFKTESRRLKMAARESGGSVEYNIAKTYVTPDVVNKEYDRIRVTNGKVDPRMLLGTMYHCVVTENLWDAIKRFRIEELNLKRLRRECEMRTKMIRPEVFGLSAMDVEEASEPLDVH